MPTPEKIDLKNLTRDALQRLLTSSGKAKYRAEQVFRWIHQRDAADFDEMTNLAKATREELKRTATITRLAPVHEDRADDGTTKYIFELDDGSKIEAVWIPGVDESDNPPLRATEREETKGVATDENGSRRSANEESNYRVTLCISTQAGCAMGCTFCHTGTMKLVRNLRTAEIVEQVMSVQRLHPERKITNLVLMGMGEPLHNYDNMVAALRILLDDLGMNFSHKRVTVSTVGLIPEMERLSRELPVNLAVSLHAPTNDVRDAIVPLNRKYPVEELIAAVRRYPMPRKKVVMFEYVVLGGVNDRPEDVNALAKLLDGLPCKINLIPFNEWPGAPYKRPTPERLTAFRDALVKKGFFTFVRATRGRKILAACGQLASETRRTPRSLPTIT